MINIIFVVDFKIMGIDDGFGVIEWLLYEIFNKLSLNIWFFFIFGYEGFFKGKISLLVVNID